MKPVLRASIIAPLTVIPVSLLYAASLLGLSAGHADPKDLLKSAALLAGAGLIVAYFAMFGIGLPSYLIAKRHGRANYLTTLLAATFASAVAASPALSHHNQYLSSFAFFMIFAVPIAVCFTAIIRRSTAATVRP